MIAGCAGFFLAPLTALFTAYASEAAFPEGQASITGYLFAISQTFGFVLGIACVSWIDNQNKWKVTLVLIIHSAFYLLALVVNFVTPEQLNKTKFERKQKMSGDKSQSLIVPIEEHRVVRDDI